MLLMSNSCVRSPLGLNVTILNASFSGLNSNLRVKNLGW